MMGHGLATPLGGLAVAVAAAGGCATFRVPELPVIEDRPGPAVAVYLVAEGPARPAWAPLVAALADAGFVPTFVAAASEAPPDTPVVESYAPNRECANSPGMGLYLLSLGILPGIGCEEFGYRFDLRRSATSPSQPIDTRIRLFAAVGWLVGPLNLLPRFSADLPREKLATHERRALRAAVLAALEPP